MDEASEAQKLEEELRKLKEEEKLLEGKLGIDMSFRRKFLRYSHDSNIIMLL